MSQEHAAAAGGVSGPEEVLSYWFPQGINDADLQTLQRQGKRWMAGGPEVDREITERFREVLEQARRGELDHWAGTPRGRLALIIVLHQFSRNIYRGSPLSYSQYEKALKLALEGVGRRGAKLLLTPPGHSEALTLQDRVVRHAEEEAANVPPHQRTMAEFGLSQATAARHVIARFGRHPHRNEILGRDSTPEELEYLRTETPPHLRRPPS